MTSRILFCAQKFDVSPWTFWLKVLLHRMNEKVFAWTGFACRRLSWFQIIRLNPKQASFFQEQSQQPFVWSDCCLLILVIRWGFRVPSQDEGVSRFVVRRRSREWIWCIILQHMGGGNGIHWWRCSLVLFRQRWCLLYVVLCIRSECYWFLDILPRSGCYVSVQTLFPGQPLCICWVCEWSL